MNTATHAIVDLSTNAAVVTGSGADMMQRSDLLSQPTRYALRAVTPPTAPERVVVGSGSAPQPSITVPTAVTVAARNIVPGVTIDREAEARIESDLSTLDECGLKRPDKWFAAGTDMLDVGHSTYHALHQGYDELPAFREAAEAAISKIEAEHRRDVVVTLDGNRPPRLDTDGRLHIGDESVVVSADGWRAMARMLPEVLPGQSGEKSWLVQMSASARAAAVTDAFDRHASAVKLGAKTRKVMLRLRDDDKVGPALWSVNGPRYPGRPTDADAVLRRMIGMVDGTPDGSTARGSVVIDPNTSRMTAEVVWWNTTIVNPAVGDVFRAFVRGSTRDDGLGAYYGAGGVEAIRCINCSTAESVAEVIRGIHRSVDGVLRAVDATAAARDMITPLLRKWGYVADRDMTLTVVETDPDSGEEVERTLVSPDEIFAAICADGDLLGACLKDAGILRDSAVEILLSAHKDETAVGRMDGSALDIVRAIAKAAQHRSLDVFQRAAMERGSGQLLAILADGSIVAG